jgi:hypothetical protein
MSDLTVQPDMNAKANAQGLRRLGLAAGLRPTSDTLEHRQQSFREVLTKASDRRGLGEKNLLEGGDADARAQREARKAAEDFVSIAFIEPVLKKLRETSNAAPPFAPGPAEKQFRSMMDAQIARQVVRAAHFPLVDELARRMLHSPQAAPQARTPDVAPAPAEAPKKGDDGPST